MKDTTNKVKKVNNSIEEKDKTLEWLESGMNSTDAATQTKASSFIITYGIADRKEIKFEFMARVFTIVLKASQNGKIVHHSLYGDMFLTLMTLCGFSSPFSDLEVAAIMDGGVLPLFAAFSDYTDADVANAALECMERVLVMKYDEQLSRHLICNSLLLARSSLNPAVTERANRMLVRYGLLVKCGLCHEEYSMTRLTSCPECKCYVCGTCDCSSYHINAMDLEWSSKRVCKMKKKRKAKKKKHGSSESSHIPVVQLVEGTTPTSESTALMSPTPVLIETGLATSHQTELMCEGQEPEYVSHTDDELDFVLYLGQTGSILALNNLMDSLEKDDSARSKSEIQVIQNLRDDTIAFRANL